MRLALFVLPLLAACGPKAPTSTTPTEPTPTAAELEGRWRSDCVEPGTGQGFDLEFLELGQA